MARWIIQPAVIVAIDYALRPVVHDDYPRALLAKLAATGVSMVLNFLVYDRFIWPHTSVRPG